MATAEARTLTEGAHTVTYELTRKRVKNLNLRVHADGSVHVSAAPRVPLAEIERFVRAHIGFILRARARLSQIGETKQSPLVLTDGVTIPLYGKPYTLRIREGRGRAAVAEDTLTLFVKDPADRALCHRALQAFLRAEAERVLTALLQSAFPLFAPHPPTLPTLTLRDMKTRWGICRPQSNRITLNLRLVHVPPACAAYVVYHELAHFRHPNHSKQFYAYLAAFLPDWQERRRILNDFVIPVFQKEEEA